MNIEIKAVDQANYTDIISLRVNESQQTYIETPLQCLQEAEECHYYKPVGLYTDGILVGFAMYGYFPHEQNGGRVWLDRYLIDKNHQGRGLGKTLMKALLGHLITLYHCSEVYLSIYEDNAPAMNLYQRFGFYFTGEKDINGELVMVKQL